MDIKSITKIAAGIVITLVVLSIVPSPCICSPEESPETIVEAKTPRKLSITAGKSIVIHTLFPVKRVSIVSTDVADATALTPNQIYVIGKTPGLTNMTLWRSDNSVAEIIDIEVSPDVSRLKETLFRLLPEEKDIKVTATHDRITLTGTVTSAANLSRVLSLAAPYAPLDEERKPKIANLLEVAGVHQVMLEVRVAEMSRSLLRRLGFNFNYLGTTGKTAGLDMLNRLSSLPSATFPATEMKASDSVNSIFRFIVDGTPWTILIDALKEEGLLKVLAEPTLITLSGKTANFLAGGEIPVPVPQSTGAGGSTITIEYKPFGIKLNFTPTVLSNKKINMQVSPEVSDLDFSNAVTASGFVVPALTTRRVSTVIELSDGQSFVIAGLLKEDIREIVSKFPVLGDIPVLGAFFRSSSFRKNETELIVIVTTHLVKPLDASRQSLPTDQYIEPTDSEFYLLGSLQGQKKKFTPLMWGFEGDFGHMFPR